MVVGKARGRELRPERGSDASEALRAGFRLELGYFIKILYIFANSPRELKKDQTALKE